MNQPSMEQFLSACGSTGPLRVSVGHRDQPVDDTWTFRQPFLVVGRRPDSDLALDHWQVSRRHAYLQLIEGRYFCVDLGSRTGTHGGDANERFGWLEPDRAIQIGPFSVRPEWPEASPAEASTTPGVTWELPGRAIGQSVWRMDRQIALVGRSPACRIRIVQPDVSKFHCSLILTSMGVWAVDLLGQNGIFVNDEPVRCARLEDGDVLRIGGHLLRPRYDTELPSVDSRPAGSELARISSAVAIRPAGPATPTFPGPAPVWSGTVDIPAGVIDPTVGALVHQFGLMQQQMFDQFHQTMMMMFEGFAALHREQAGTLREEFDQVRKLSQEIEALRVETARLAESAKAAESARPSERPRPAPNGRAEPSPLAGLIPPADPIRRAMPPPPDSEVDIHAQLCLRLASIQSERQNRWQKILGMMSSRS